MTELSGFSYAYPVTSQTYSRKIDIDVLAPLASFGATALPPPAGCRRICASCARGTAALKRSVRGRSGMHGASARSRSSICACSSEFASCSARVRSATRRSRSSRVSRSRRTSTST